MLVVDDDVECGKSMLNLLKRRDCETDLAVSGKVALSLVAENRYDVALLDFQMPELDGIELFEQIKMIQPNLTTIIVSGNIGEDNMQRSTKAGIFVVLHKPVSGEDLLAHIQRAAEQTTENERKSADSQME